jgi:eukaryotic-like serine/threonine-protein kinase
MARLGAMGTIAPPADPAQTAEITVKPERLTPLLGQSGQEEPAPKSRKSLFIEDNWDEREAVRAAANRELHSELLGPAVRRLAGIALVTAAVLAAYLGCLMVFMPRHEPPWRDRWPTLMGLMLGGICVSLALYGVTRIKSVRPAAVLDLGYVYLFLLTLLLGLIRHAYPWAATEIMRQVSPVVIPILAFGALIAAPPKKALMVSFGAAAMDPLAYAMMRSPGHALDIEEIVFLLASPFLAALIAQRISVVVHRLSEGIVKAREVGSYSLVERLGVGGMAEVWRANHRMLARPAAVKLIRPKVLVDYGPQDSERLLRLFTREARTTASLRSPHTIQLYDFGISREGAFYYVMELLDGIDLKTLVERYGPQPSERVAHLLLQACHSLEEAHAKNFVHRDVKPANIYTCHYGLEYDFVKVLDFGLVLDRHPTAEELEDEHRFVGTPAVMAPEMVRFQAPVDARADIYALGVVGYWLLTGKRVFDAETRHDLLVMHAHQKPIRPSKRVPLTIHEGLEALVMTCLEKNPNRRPQTAHELKDSLAALRFEHPWTEERCALWWMKNLERRSSRIPPPPKVPEIHEASAPSA